MTYLQSFLMGLVQGLGEFLPISSSAHLVILPWFIKFKDPGLAFDVALHLGTLFAVVGFFYKDWLQIFKGTFYYVTSSDATKRHTHRQDYWILIYLIAATVPAAVVGALLNDWAETVLRSPLLLAFNMVLMGLVLLMVDKKMAGARCMNEINIRGAIAVGLAQCLALFPGVSRSGITITTALALGFKRQDAARLSFLLSTPIIFGACIFKYKYFAEAFTDLKILFAILVAAVSGFLSIKYLLKLVQNYSYAVFCYYRFAFGAVVVLFYVLRGSV
ncbi:MAG: undecaprenyl-diphosphate phosphatase [Deltaproteobacteria bacterium]|nr:undecaprenyl-diphosphate phosphatase [Deltaproteobacteria bacterium]